MFAGVATVMIKKLKLAGVVTVMIIIVKILRDANLGIG